MNNSPLFHSPRLLMPAFALMFERFAYYGSRGVLMLYMMGGLGWEPEKATKVYGAFVYAIVLLPFLGAVTGIFSARISIIVGGVLEALGLVVVVLGGEALFVAGMSVFILGSGFIKPNIYVYTVGLYKHEKHKLDSAMTFLFAAVFVGLFIMSSLFGWLPDDSWAAKFVLCAVAALGAGFVFIFDFLFTDKKPQPAAGRPAAGINTGAVLMMVLALVTVTVALVQNATFDQLMYTLRENGKGLAGDKYLIGVSILVGVLLGILWGFLRVYTLYKIALGVLLFGLLNALACVMGSGYGVNFLHLSVIAVSEMLILPSLFAIIGKSVNPRFSGFFFAIYFALGMLTGRLGDELAEAGPLNHTGRFLVMFVVSVVFAGLCFGLGYVLKSNMKKTPEYL